MDDLLPTHSCRRLHTFRFNPSNVGQDGLTFCQRRIKKSKSNPRVSGNTPSWWLCDSTCPGPVPLGESYEVPVTVPVSECTRKNIGTDRKWDSNRHERMKLLREKRDANRPKCKKCGKAIYARRNANQDRLALCLCNLCWASSLKDKLRRRTRENPQIPKCKICGKPIRSHGKHPEVRLARGTHDKCQQAKDKLRNGHVRVTDHRGQDIVIVRSWI